MKNDRLIDLGLTGYEELFMSTEERLDAKKPKVEAIPLAALTPFRNHPFKVKEDEEMAQLMRSIADAGVLSPALARPLPDGGYELISGHRRLAACKALGMDAMPVIVRDLTDEEAVITMVDSNLQREHILPSEKAFAYKMKYDAIKRSPGRKENGDQLGHQIKSIDSLAENSPDSRNQIQRYADIDVSNERMTINLTDEEGHVLSFNLSQSEVHYVLHMVERRLNSFMRDDGGGGFSDED